MAAVDRTKGSRNRRRDGIATDDMQSEVALKVIAPGVIHKTEAGGVRLHLACAEQVSAAAREELFRYLLDCQPAVSLGYAPAQQHRARYPEEPGKARHF